MAYTPVTIPTLTEQQHRAEYARLTTEIGDSVPRWADDFDRACAIQRLRTEAHLHYAASIGLVGDSDDVDTPPQRRHSSVDTLERHQNTEAACLVLRAAADHIYNKRDNGNPDNYRAVDLLDMLRDRLREGRL